MTEQDQPHHLPTFPRTAAARSRGRSAGQPIDTRESHDLVVVGGGISGLAAAYFYRARTSPSARILILDNHDDFGGHAKRNEFRPGGRLWIANGGAQGLISVRVPSPESLVPDP